MTDLRPELVHIADLAATHELFHQPRPVSRVPLPGGGEQPETEAERIRRMVETAVMHLFEQGLIVISPDAEKIMNEQGVPIARTPVPES